MSGNSFAALMWLMGCALTAFGQKTVTIHLKPDKTVMQPEDVLTIEIWGRLDPGVGSQVLWNPGNGNPIELGTVEALGIAQFWVSVGEQPVKWLGWTPGPGTAFPLSPKFGSNAVVVGCGASAVKQTDNLLLTVTLQLANPVEGVLNFVPWNPGYSNVVVLSVPSQPNVVGDAWTLLGEPLQIQVIPTPGVAFLPMLAAIATIARRRRCHE